MSDINMADVFDLPVNVDTEKRYIGEESELLLFGDKADAAIQAINNHDRLTAENEALREEVERFQAEITERDRRAHIISPQVFEDALKERDQLKVALQSVVEAANKLSFGMIEDEASGEESAFTSHWFGKLQDAIAATPEQRLAAHDAEVIERVVESVTIISGDDPLDPAVVYVDELFEYADQLRQQAKESQS